MKTMKSTIKAVQRGFTLIELMIVLAIVGIIAVVAAPLFNDYTIRARVAEAGVLVAPIQTALELQVATTGSFPVVGTATGQYTAPATEGDWVASATYARTSATVGVVTMTLKAEDALGDSKSGTVLYTGTISNNAINWAATCPTTGTAPNQVGVQDAHCPN